MSQRPVFTPAPLRLLALLLALLALAPRAARAQDPTPWEWAEGRMVQAVEWDGLVRLNPSEPQSMIETRAGEVFSAQRLSLDIARLYRSGRFGWPREGIPPISVVVRQGDGEGVIVEFTVHERARVRREPFVIQDGDEVLEQKELDELIRTRAGSTYDPYQIKRDVRALRRALRAKGHLLAEIDERVETHASGVDVYFTIRPGPAVYVDEIVYEGAEQLDPSIVASAQGPDALETKERQLWGLLEPGVYDPEALERDLDRIVRYYRSQGFLDAHVYKLDEQYSLDGEAVTVVLGVEEGPRYGVRRVAVEGTRVLDGDRILERLPLQPGRPFLADDLRGSLEQIRHLYGQRAYVHARVDVDVRYDRQRSMLDVTLRVDEGPRVRIEQIRIVGNEKTQEEVIRRELSFYPGEYFDADAVQASLGRLSRLRYFKDVRIDFEPGSEPGRENVVLYVEEARTGSFVVGGGVSTATGFFGNISLNQRNFDILDPPTSLDDFLSGRFFTGAGQNLSISIQPGRERSQYSIEFTEPWLLGLPVPFTVQGSARDRQREDWLESRLGARIGLGYRITQDLIARMVYRIERVRVSDLDTDTVPDAIEVAGNNLLSGVRFSLTYNQNLLDRDFVLYGGYAFSVYYELVGTALGGDHDFHQAGVEANWQHAVLSWPGHHKWVIALRGELGWQEKLGDDPVPIFERFYAGGPNSIRGFQFRSVGPQFDDDPIGGSFLVTGTAEFSYPLFQDLLRGVVFVDAGTVTRRIRQFTYDEMRVAAGFGFRIKVPFFPAPVALDFAWPLKALDDDDEQVFSFSVGFGGGF